MHTTHLLPISPSMHVSGLEGVLGPRWVGVPGPGGGLPLVLGGVSQHAMGHTPPVDRILDTRF